MPFHPEIQKALDTYKKEKGLRYYTHKSFVVQAVEALPESDKENFIEIFKSFIHNNSRWLFNHSHNNYLFFILYVLRDVVDIKVKEASLSFDVFQAFIDSMLVDTDRGFSFYRFKLSYYDVFLEPSAPNSFTKYHAGPYVNPITVHWDNHSQQVKYSIEGRGKIKTGTLTKADLKEHYPPIAEVAKTYRLADESAQNTLYCRSLTHEEKETIFMALVKKGHAIRIDGNYYECAFFFPLVNLYNHNMLENDNFKDIVKSLAKAKNQFEFKSAIENLSSSDILTKANLNILFSINSIKLSALHTLSVKNILTQSNFDKLHSSSEEFAHVLVDLSSEYTTFTQHSFNELFSAARENNNFGTIVVLLAKNKFKAAINYLCSSDILTNANLNILCLMSDIKLSVLHTLSVKNILTQSNFDKLHSSSEEFAQALVDHSTEYNTFTQEFFQEYFNKLSLAASPQKYLVTLEALRRINHLTQANRTAFLPFTGSPVAIDALYRARILTQANIELLLNPLNSYLSSEVSSAHLWSRLPAHLLTQNVFNNLIVQAQTAIPQEAITNYINQLLRPPSPVLARANTATGDSQSTHRVHDSVAASLRRLAQRYHLTPTEISVQLTEFENFREEIRAGSFNYLNTSNSRFNEDKCTRAIESITRIATMAKNENINDGQTQFSLKKIIALIWKAVTDEAEHDVSIGLNAKERLINELGNIQDAYGRNLPSCSGGTMNGLVNILDGIHSDVTLVLINRDTVSVLMLAHARRIFMENFVQKAVDPRFIEHVCQEIDSDNPSHWNNTGLAQWYENCLQQAVESTEQETDLKMQHAKLSDEETRSIKTRIKNEWIPASLVGFRDKYMLNDTHEKYAKKLEYRLNSNASLSNVDDNDQIVIQSDTQTTSQRTMHTNSLSHGFFPYNTQKSVGAANNEDEDRYGEATCIIS